MSATAVRQPVVVEIEGITQAARFPELADAVTAAWDSLRALPLGHYQYAAYEQFFSEGAAERVQEFLDRNGELVLSFAIAGRSHAVRIRPNP